jgi:type I restriction enzyme R subunit
VAETIENNVRRLIIDEMAVNPKYYEKMSQLLDALILQRKQEALDYKAYLARIVELTREVSKPESQSSYPAAINAAALRALYDNLEDVAASAVRERPEPDGDHGAASDREERALALDRAIRQVKKADWRGNRFKEREVRNAIKDRLGDEDALVDRIFEIVKAQRDY